MRNFIIAILLTLTSQLAMAKCDVEGSGICKQACQAEAQFNIDGCYRGCFATQSCTEQEARCAQRVRETNERCQARCDKEKGCGDLSSSQKPKVHFDFPAK